MAARLRKGDRVEVIAGADKGKRGEILRLMPKDNRAVVQGVNVATKHRKQERMGQQGGIVQEEASIHLSNLMLVDGVTDKRTRVGFRVLDDGSKVRVARATGKAIEG